LPGQVGPGGARDALSKLVVIDGKSGLFQFPRQRDGRGHGASLPRVGWVAIPFDGADVKTHARHGHASLAQSRDQLFAQKG
jgi:hypothetical protein